jgi:CDP-glucose 4,6-dehydratase
VEVKILVTGARGFLGRHLVLELLHRGLVVELVRDSVSMDGHLLRSPTVVVRGDFEQVERAIAEYEIDTVVHLAAQTQVSVAAADPIGSLEANVRGTWQVMEACRRQFVRRVVVASSDKAYGDGATPYFEEQGLRAHGIYAASKACSDLIAQAYAREYGMSVAITRCGNLYGPGHTNRSTLIPGTIRSILRGERPQLRSNGGPKRDYLYVQDAVAAYLKLIDSEHGGAFNIGTGRGVTVLEVVGTISRLMHSGLEPEMRSCTGGVEIEDQVVDSARAKALLAWEPTVTLERGLAETIDWYRNWGPQ